MTRFIIKKWDVYLYKVFEYLGSIVICLIALFNYSSEMDGIIFVFGLTILVIISYYLKYGPIFLVSLFSIILNVLILTRTFWLNIPWWLYILFIGIILICFAVYNEVNEKKNKTIENILKKIDV